MSSMKEKACYVRSLRPDGHGNVTMPQDIALLLAERLIDRADFERALADRVHYESALRGYKAFKEEAEAERDALRVEVKAADAAGRLMEAQRDALRKVKRAAKKAVKSFRTPGNDGFYDDMNALQAALAATEVKP